MTDQSLEEFEKTSARNSGRIKDAFDYIRREMQKHKQDLQQKYGKQEEERRKKAAIGGTYEDVEVLPGTIEVIEVSSGESDDEDSRKTGQNVVAEEEDLLQVLEKRLEEHGEKVDIDVEAYIEQQQQYESQIYRPPLPHINSSGDRPNYNRTSLPHSSHERPVHHNSTFNRSFNQNSSYNRPQYNNNYNNRPQPSSSSSSNYSRPQPYNNTHNNGSSTRSSGSNHYNNRPTYNSNPPYDNNRDRDQQQRNFNPNFQSRPNNFNQNNRDGGFKPRFDPNRSQQYHNNDGDSHYNNSNDEAGGSGGPGGYQQNRPSYNQTNGYNNQQNRSFGRRESYERGPPSKTFKYNKYNNDSEKPRSHRGDSNGKSYRDSDGKEKKRSKRYWDLDDLSDDSGRSRSRDDSKEGRSKERHRTKSYSKDGDKSRSRSKERRSQFRNRTRSESNQEEEEDGAQYEEQYDDNREYVVSRQYNSYKSGRWNNNRGRFNNDRYDRRFNRGRRQLISSGESSSEDEED